MSALRPRREKSVNELEGALASDTADARLVTVRAIPIERLTNGDLRYLIRRRVALSYLAPSAVEWLEKTPLATACSHSGDHLLALRHVDAADLVACSLRSRSTAIVSAAIAQFTSDMTEELELDTDLTLPEPATSYPIAITTCSSLHAAGGLAAPDPHALPAHDVPGSGFRNAAERTNRMSGSATGYDAKSRAPVARPVGSPHC